MQCVKQELCNVIVSDLYHVDRAQTAWVRAGAILDLKGRVIDSEMLVQFLARLMQHVVIQ
jgi:hypothetical protein